MKHILRILILPMLFFPFPVLAEETNENITDIPDTRTYVQRVYDYWIDGASITLGVGLREADVTVTRISDNAIGKLVHRNEEAYFLSYSTKANYFKESNFGYSWMFNISSFNLTKQQVGKEQYQDLGTRLKGYYAYVVPTFFYNWGDKYDGSFIRTGIGLGLGATKYDGDIFLSDGSRVDLHHSISKVRTAISFFIEGRVNNWGLGISAAGPSFEQDDYKISVADVAVKLSYSYFL